ncbi:SGNH/GDSL hydrolase family protein [Streptomyces pluripotens]|uniref:SGNH/GDSL hydrolase family protein n=1 Tax=Streptomyces pluripotens TaxID=1355015 RepID=UPI001F21D81C|nr:SGNH/GDSL hydrolase family protein [Streptomyces pluripotens]
MRIPRVGPPGVGVRRAGVAVLYLLGLSGLALTAIWLAVRLTPLQTVSAAGQTVEVGATSPDWRLSGPGELDLFGQSLPTVAVFTGPIRPRLQLTHITENRQMAQLLQPGDHQQLSVVGHRLATGWVHYGAGETAVAVGVVVLALLAWTGLRRMPLRRALTVLACGVALVTAVNAIGFYLLASQTPGALRHVRSLADLVGRSPTAAVPKAHGPALTNVEAVVLGDSTAAGTGNRPLPNPAALDSACHRSEDAYARVLARTNHWNVLNLACSGATVRDGILGLQIRGGTVVPPQLAEAQRATRASAVIVSVGANDVGWADLVRLCAKARSCDDKASTAFFQRRLSRFALDYSDLLKRLTALPQHPKVLVNEYYDPFGRNLVCLRGEGLTSDKVRVLRDRLSALNDVLRQGATAPGVKSVRPDFSGHGLCSDQPYVQGPTGQAPLHPTAGGELAIAVADQYALS